MDISSAIRIAVRVPAYYEVCDDGRHVGHSATDFQLIRDRDTLNLKDLTADVSKRVCPGKNQGFNLCFFNKHKQSYTSLTSDSTLMNATENYWELRRLPLFVSFYDTVPVSFSQSVSLDNEACATVDPPLLLPLLGNDGGQNNQSVDAAMSSLGSQEVESLSEEVSDSDTADSTNSGESAEKSIPAQGRKGRGKKPADDDVAWEEDDEEYVGINDENQYMADQQDDQEEGAADSDSFVHDDLLVDDEAGCETSEHVTNLENPTIACGVTFEDGDTFKRAIRQYAVLKEFEIAAHYSEAKRYRGHCKGYKSKKKRCKWRIHASQLQDGKTWQVCSQLQVEDTFFKANIYLFMMFNDVYLLMMFVDDHDVYLLMSTCCWQIKKMYQKHTCATTANLEKNCMANNHWVRDRVINILRHDPTARASQMKKDLEKKYNITLSYYVVWDGMAMALEELQGKWDDSFEDVFRFKAEVERTNPGSIVDIEWALVGKKMRFTRMFVAFNSCVQGFLNGCRPFLGVDSSHLTGRWRGQLASASAVDGHNWLFPVAYGVFESESADNWQWFFEKLKVAIGSPLGLVICTDAGKGIDKGVASVFSDGVEHRECMRHLVKNFNKRYRGAVFKKHLWPASRAYNQRHFDRHYNIMKAASPRAMQWIEDNHKHLWCRWRFSHACKCDYVTNNIAETFNSWIRNEKSLALVPLLDRIRQMIMEKQDIRRALSLRLTDKILPQVTKELHAMSRNLQYVIHRGPTTLQRFKVLLKN